ncbi:hypothetical protein M422DRAFT_240803 [Sphaerobolus stellatus SS14]|nr:hypothetical protein M422DRAFT_240803 [Sphaerobolus stellatus SS14]
MSAFNQDDDNDLFTLHQSTLSALASFLEEQSAAQQALADLSAQSYIDEESEADQAENFALSTNEAENKISAVSSSKGRGVSLKEFKNIFKLIAGHFCLPREDWQLSQFWYTEDTSYRLTNALLKLARPDSRIAFLCCPTGYVAFKEKALLTQDTRLFEYDTRFAVFARGGFVHYDLDEPLSFPGADDLFHSQDIVVIDPPFHAEASQRKVATTVTHILRPGGHIVLLTGTSLSPILPTIYGAIPQLKLRSIVIGHDGMGRLQTPYGCWVGGEDEADGSGFGEVIDDN